MPDVAPARLSAARLLAYGGLGLPLAALNRRRRAGLLFAFWSMAVQADVRARLAGRTAAATGEAS